MTTFIEMNRLVNALFEKHAGDNGAVFGDAHTAFKCERDALLVSHGWEPEFFVDKVEDYVSDYEVVE